MTAVASLETNIDIKHLTSHFLMFALPIKEKNLKFKNKEMIFSQ